MNKLWDEYIRLLELHAACTTQGSGPHWTAYFTALMTAGIALMGAWIALQQWRTAQDKLRLDLFEKRMVVYEAARTALGKIFTAGDLSPRDEAEYLVGVTGSKWLFGSDVHSYLHDELWGKLIEMHCHVASLDGLEPGDERNALIGKRTQLRKWFTSQQDRLDSLFLPYLRFQHRSWKR